MLNHKHLILFLLATSLQALITPRAAGASDPTAVHLAGTETITGSKTFTNNTTFSDPTKTLLLGAASAPNISGTAFPAGAQLLISSRPNDSKIPLMVVGGYRSGNSGDRYVLALGSEGSLFTNGPLDLNAGSVANPIGDAQCSLRISTDVPVAMTVFSPYTASHGGIIMNGWGVTAVDGTTSKVYELNSQGTLRLDNPYGTTSASNYQVPQLILRDTNSTSNPSAIDVAIKCQSGESLIGTWNNNAAQFVNAPPWTGVPEIRLYPGQVDIIANLFTTFGDAQVSGRLFVSTPGESIHIKGGPNAKVGSGKLVSGAATVSNISVTPNSKVFVQNTNTGSLANVGSLVVQSKTSGTGFTVRSTNASDTSTFDYWIVEQY